MNPEVTQQTLELIHKANENPLDKSLQKSWTTGTGLVHFDLEAPAKLLVPEITPFRNRVQRVTHAGGTAANWKSVLAFNANLVDSGVEEGKRGGTIDVTLKDYVAAYKTLGLEDDVTWEAEDAGKNFDNPRNLAIKGLLSSVMVEEENVMIGGNNSLALGTPTAPTLADLTAQADGAIPQTTTLEVSVFALTHEGFRKSTVVGGIRGQVVRTNADGTTTTFGGGASDGSTATSITTATDADNTHVVTASTPVIRGALAYAWFWGPTVGAAQVLGAITSLNSIRLTTAAGTGTQAVNIAALAADNSQNSTVFDGLLYTIFGAGPETPAPANSGAFFEALATGTPGVGTTLTTDGAGGIVEIDRALRSFWDNQKLSPDEIWVNAQELISISQLVIGGGGAPLFRFTTDVRNVTDPSQITFAAGAVVGSYLNKTTMAGGKLIPIRLHPDIVPGMMLYMIWQLPFKITNVDAVHRMKVQREYNQVDWPATTRKAEIGIYVAEVYQNFAPFAFGTTVNIAPLP